MTTQNRNCNFAAVKMLLLFLCGMIFSGTPAQSSRISGTVTDAASGQPLPFVSLVLQNNHTGVQSNEWGEFDLLIPRNTAEDSLQVYCFGYQRRCIALSELSPMLEIQLEAGAYELEEITIMPMPAEYYVREAIRKLPENYPTDPFGTYAYYREVVNENGAFVRSDECVFRTFYPAYLDTGKKNQHQLMLFRRADHVSRLQFMLREREKGKEKRKDEKENDSARIDMEQSLASFGGPAHMLGSSKPGTKSWAFLDTAKLSSFTYSFAGRSVLGEHTLMLISFESKKTLDHVREKGRLFIDIRSFAIVKIENEGDFVIPFWVKPILFMAGFAVKEPEYSRHLSFMKAGDRWYPQHIRYNMEAKLTKRYMFSANDHSHLKIEQLFGVNKLFLAPVDEIDPAKRFDPGKDMESQVHNDTFLKWDQMNLIKQ